MSKIFEALQRANNETAEIALAPTTTDGDLPSRAAPEPVPRAEVPADPVPPAKPAASADWTQAVRRTPVSVNAVSPILPFEEQSTSHAAEQYRILRTRILQHPKKPRSVVVSSAMPGDGKTITAINLAGSLALKKEGSVLLLDADLRRSSAAASLGLPASPGLQQVLEGKATLEEALVAVSDFRELYVLPAGERSSNPAQLSDSARWTHLSARLREMFTHVVVDSPPIGATADYDLIQAACDGVVIVIRPDHTDRKLALSAVRAVPPEKLIGVFLNCVPKWFLGRFGSGYATYPYYGTSETPAAPRARM